MTSAHHDPVKKQQILPRDPKCMCLKPLSIYIRPGEHIHPCPVHPEYTIYGSQAVWS